MAMLQSNKLNIILDGQFGSTGKGLFSGFIAQKERVDVAITNAAPNAGHTYVDDDHHIVAHHLPITGILSPTSLIYICAGAIIDPDLLARELHEYKVPPMRVVVHPRAAIITKEDVESEKQKDSSVTKIASTQHGVGTALARKILRSGKVAMDCNALYEMGVQVRELNMDRVLREFPNAVMEVPQGIGLGLNSGLAYPYCTSREISVAQAMSDAQTHPSRLGNVFMSLRTYPIRVGNIYGLPEEGMLGWSGPFYPDSKELKWDQLGLEPELTTVTKRPRRVATFSHQQFKRAYELARPDYVFLNFVNYLKSAAELRDLVFQIVAGRDCRMLYGCGPHVDDVLTGIDEVIERMKW